MLLAGIAFGLIAGLLAGGRLTNLAEVRLRWMAVIFLAVVVRYGTEAALSRDIPGAEALRIPLLATAYLILLVGLWVNRRQPGLAIAFVGTLSNAVVIAVNGGHMPIWEPSLVAAGLTPADLVGPLHILLPPAIDASFLAHLGPLSDVIPIPLPLVRNVASVGDVVISLGLGFFLFATVLRTPNEASTEEDGPGPDATEPIPGLVGSARLHGMSPASAGVAGGIRPKTGLIEGLTEASVLDRPVLLGGPMPGLAEPGATIELDAGGAVRTGPPLAQRVRRHPYIRLALDPSFSALWTAGVISLFGDRVNQIALAVIVLGVTGSPIAVGFVFLAAALPNLLLGPISGTLVDRWDQKQVMVVSDLLRAAVVLLIPVAVVTNVVLAYPLVFLMTSISIFFRPAREAVMPRIVASRDLLTANSANWLAETLADIVGYSLAGLFVAFLGAWIPLAFWLDAATYVLSALLILTITVPPVTRTTSAAGESILAALRVGWRFLRTEKALLTNTAQAAVAQFGAGILISVTLIYVERAMARGELPVPTLYALMEAGLGLGNLVGGLLVGILGGRLAKGRLVIIGYVAYGLCIVGLGLTGNVAAALGLAVGIGVSNMVFVIPSQTLFQQRTPGDMIGRVVGLRFSLVFASLSIAMGISGFLVTAFGVSAVLIVFGALTSLAGLAGLLVPALRDA
ncbi:MAG: MFS transporter [Chloroflexota bacterium]|nr:MFS transporter [Chloroflexota bacterium]